MKLCKVEKNLLDIYSRYIPDNMLARVDTINNLVVGLYDEEHTLGAAVIHLYDFKAMILSMIYSEEVEEGEFEEMITDLLEKNAKGYRFSRIEYIAEGTEDSLESYDFVMMNLHYVPRPGEVKKYFSTLGTIREKTQKYLDETKDERGSCEIVTGDRLSRVQINYYNEVNRENPLVNGEYDDRISLFLIKDGYPVAGVLARENSDGDLVFVWMNYEPQVNRFQRIFLFLSQLEITEQYYEPDTKVIVCPFMKEVMVLCTTIGFEEDTEAGIQTRIYTRYL